jgi:acetyl-CoA synthetase
VAGHRIGTAELESSLVSHKSISEAAVCGVPDPIKGEVIIAFLVPKQGVEVNDDLRKGVIESVRRDIGAIATPQQIYFVSKLPKTRSGKIMRRLLKAIASNEKIGDVSTLEDGAAVSEVQAAFDELKKQIM